MKNNFIIYKKELEYLLVKEVVLEEFCSQNKCVPTSEQLDKLIDAIIWSASSSEKNEENFRRSAKYVVGLEK